MYKVLVTSRSFAKNSDKPIRYLEEHECKVEYTPKGHLKGSELAQFIKGYDALIVGIDQVNGEVLAASDKLKVICMHGTGIDHIDVKAASERGIYVGNAPGGNTNAVAELTVGLMIASSRFLTNADKSIRDFGWERKIGQEITGKTIGLIGMGNIGKRVVELLSGFDPKFIANDKFEDAEFANKTGLSYVSLKELLTESDIISLHVPLTDETLGIISKSEFELMKKNALLINTSRGALVNEDALYLALKNNRIAGAALDAFAMEPLEEYSKLRELSNIVLTPHIGASTYESALEVDMINVRTVVGVLKGNKLYNVVNKQDVARQLI